jgi:hypothetical protein
MLSVKNICSIEKNLFSIQKMHRHKQVFEGKQEGKQPLLRLFESASKPSETPSNTHPLRPNTHPIRHPALTPYTTTTHPCKIAMYHQHSPIIYNMNNKETNKTSTLAIHHPHSPH